MIPSFKYEVLFGADGMLWMLQKSLDQFLEALVFEVSLRLVSTRYTHMSMWMTQAKTNNQVNQK